MSKTTTPLSCCNLGENSAKRFEKSWRLSNFYRKSGAEFGKNGAEFGKFGAELLLVLWNFRVDLVRPGGNAAAKVFCLSLEAALLHEFHRAGAANAAFALEYYFASRVELAHPRRQLAERYQFGTLDLCEREFFGLTHIDQLNFFARIHPRF
jgi:hypothetical protein